VTAPADLHTTIYLAVAAGACDSGLSWAREWVAARGGDDEMPVPLASILDDAPAEHALDWTVWSLRAVPPEQEAARDRLARLFAADAAERVLPLFEAARPGDTRPREAIAVARRFADGEATKGQLAAAWAAAGDAAWAAAGDAARAAAGAAAWAAARDAAGDAERARQAGLLRARLAGEVTA